MADGTMTWGDNEPEPLSGVSGKGETGDYVMLLVGCIAFLIAIGAVYMIFMKIQSKPSEIGVIGWLVFGFSLGLLFLSGNYCVDIYKTKFAAPKQ